MSTAVATEIRPFNLEFEDEQFDWEGGRAAAPAAGVYFDEAARGGHFAPREEPQLFGEELRAAFRRVR